MKTNFPWMLLLLAFLSIQGCCSAPVEIGYLNYLKYLQKYEAPKGSILPNGGILLNHPTNLNFKYYYSIQQWMVLMPQNKIHKPPGLYVSRDGGKSWDELKETSCIFDLFIHPKTGTLYAIFKTDRIITLKDRALIFSGEYKLAMSANGREWIDITAPGMLNAGLIFQDPDNEARVCIIEGFPVPQIYQAVDDKYSHWNIIQQNEWYEKHPGWKDSDYDGAASQRQYGNGSVPKTEKDHPKWH